MVEELLTLPLQLWGKFAELLNLVEETGTWPTPPTQGLIALMLLGRRVVSAEADVNRDHGGSAPSVGLDEIRDIMSWQEGAGLIDALRTFVWTSRFMESARVDSADLVGIVDRLEKLSTECRKKLHSNRPEAGLE